MFIGVDFLLGKIEIMEKFVIFVEGKWYNEWIDGVGVVFCLDDMVVNVKVL